MKKWWCRKGFLAFLKQQKTSGRLAFSFPISSVDDLGNSVSNVFDLMDLERECNTKDLKGKKFHHIPQIRFQKGIRLN